LEKSLRQLFERLGAKIDSLMSGNAQQGASLRSTLGNLSIALQRAVDANLRKDEKGVSCLAPHHFRVLLDYDFYSQFTQPGLQILKEELTTSAKQYIADRRYKLSEPITLILTYDPIVSSTVVRADFGEPIPVQLPEKPENNEEKPRDFAYHLTPLSGPVETSIDLKNFKAGGSPVTIGRGQDNVVVLDDNSVSKFHATLAIDSGGKIVLADCGSTNGTFLNDQAVSGRSEVKPGDMLGFGDVRFRLERVE